ncbi:MAG: hypothetical protein V1779_00030 [bacterium]
MHIKLNIEIEQNVINESGLDKKYIENLVNDILGMAINYFGKPKIEVLNLKLIGVVNMPPYCQLIDSNSGKFTINLSYFKNETFIPILAHEIAHLLNAEIFDAYVEGLNNVLAEIITKVYDNNSKDFDFPEANKREQFYKYSFLMMKEIVEEIGINVFNNFLSYAVETNGNSKINHIHINNWLNNLDKSKVESFKKIVKKYQFDIFCSMYDSSLSNYWFDYNFQ